MSPTTPDRLRTLAEMDDLVRRAHVAGDVESVLIAKMVAAEARRLREEPEPPRTRE